MFETPDPDPNDHSPEATAAHSLVTFENQPDFDRWLHSEIPALGGIRPVTLLETETGRQQVRDILGRIEWGIYS